MHLVWLKHYNFFVVQQLQSARFGCSEPKAAATHSVAMLCLHTGEAHKDRKDCLLQHGIHQQRTTCPPRARNGSRWSPRPWLAEAVLAECWSCSPGLAHSEVSRQRPGLQQQVRAVHSMHYVSP
jgi:hypothetical protein